MKINEKTAKRFFLENFPDGVGYDFAGRKMILEDYGNDKVETGWNIDHILPLSNGGTNAKINLQCTNVKTNHIKGNKMQWSDNSMDFKTIKFKKLHKIIKVNETEGEKEYNLDEKDFALKLFKKQFPLGVGYDFMGRKIILEDYLNGSVYSGWDIVKLNPNNSKIKDERNYAIFNMASVLEKNNKTSWIADGRYMQIERKNGAFKIVEVIHRNGYTSKRGVLYGIS